MKISNTMELVKLLEPENCNVMPKINNIIGFLGLKNFEQALDIGKKKLNEIFETAKEKMDEPYHVSDLLKHDRIKYFETYDGGLYLIAFTFKKDPHLSGKIIFNFWEKTNIPELYSNIQSYGHEINLQAQGVGAQ